MSKRIDLLKRPLPPKELADTHRLAEAFVPAPELLSWIREVFILSGGALWNPDHAHLEDVTMGALWTSAEEIRQGVPIAATAEMPSVLGARWCKARSRAQLLGWFGEIPDFILTFDAVFAAATPNTAWCSRVEHELYHCGQKLDEDGEPKFGFGGEPVLAIRAHDVEEFVGCVERYGPTGRNVQRLVDAGKSEPLVARSEIALACGTCGGRI